MYEDKGGHAFPMGDGSYPGMSLRDYFAAAALQGLCAYEVTAKTATDDATVKGAAQAAYRFADAMLHAR